MNDEITPAGLNGVTEPGNKRPYFTGDDSFVNPLILYEYYHINDDGDRDDFEAAEYANIYDWNKTLALNKWNTPAEQVKRLEDAGLNPLFYLGGNAGTTPAANAGPATTPNLKHSNKEMQNILGTLNTVLPFVKQLQEYSIAKEANKINSYKALTERMLATELINDLVSLQDYRDFVLTPLQQATVLKIKEETNNLVKDGVIKEKEARRITADTLRLAAAEQESWSRIRLMGTLEDVNNALVTYYGSLSNYYSKIAEPMANELVERAGLDHNEALKLSKEAVNACIEGRMLSFQDYLLHKYGEWKEFVLIRETVMRGMMEGSLALKNVTNTVFNPVGVGNGGTTNVPSPTGKGLVGTKPFGNTTTNP